MFRNIARQLASVISILVSASVKADVLPFGTVVEARFWVPMGSRISHAGDRVQATVIAPVFGDGQVLIPQGAVVSGAVGAVEQVGLGLKHLIAGIRYRFGRVELPNGDTIPITARVVQVETAKERVNTHGTITGIYPPANVSSSVALYAFPLLWLDPEVGFPVFANRPVPGL